MSRPGRADELAPLLEECRRERERLAAALREIAERSHDAKSALSAALIDAELLARSGRASEEVLRELAPALEKSLLRLRGILEETALLARVPHRQD